VFNKDVKVPLKVRRTLSSVGTSSSNSSCTLEDIVATSNKNRRDINIDISQSNHKRLANQFTSLIKFNDFRLTSFLGIIDIQLGLFGTVF
jgi:hypothetical protein